MFIKLKDLLVDKFLDWRTGKSKEQRIYDEWYEQTIVTRAHTIENMFMNFKYVIEVKPSLWFDCYDVGPITWVPEKNAREFFYPNRALGENAVWTWARGNRSQHDGMFHFDEMGGRDHVFVATNNDRDAMMISLKYQ